MSFQEEVGECLKAMRRRGYITEAMENMMKG